MRAIERPRSHRATTTVELSNGPTKHILFIDKRSPAEAEERLAATLADLMVQVGGNWHVADGKRAGQPKGRGGARRRASYWDGFGDEAESVAATIGTGTD